MCGRFTLHASRKRTAAQFGLAQLSEFAPRYNIAPTQMVLGIRMNEDKAREAILLRWGLIPPWADDMALGSRMINARSEAAAAKPAFRHAFRRLRCLILADGFYEWMAVGGKKQPYYIRLRDERPFAFAGLWELWKGGEDTVESCTILTTNANDLLKPLHERMPVILQHSDYDSWLDPCLQEPKTLEPLLAAYPEEEMTRFKVSLIVNSVKNDNPRCIEPLESGEQGELFGIAD